MSRSSDIAMAKNPANGRYNFAWSQGDITFDDTREHEVMGRLVEWRNRWWADFLGTHGSRINEIKERRLSTKSDAEAAAREALADMVKRGDITIEQVLVTLPPAGFGQFQVAVNWSIPNSGQKPRTVTLPLFQPAGNYAPGNAAQWAAPAPFMRAQAIDRLATLVYTYVLDVTAIPLAGAYVWANPQPLGLPTQIDRLANVLYLRVLDPAPNTPIPSSPINYVFANPQPVTEQDRIARLAFAIYVNLLDSTPIP